MNYLDFLCVGGYGGEKGGVGGGGNPVTSVGHTIAADATYHSS